MTQRLEWYGGRDTQCVAVNLELCISVVSECLR